MYKAYITHVTNIRPAENADRLNACEVFGNTTIIDKTITEDTLILYLPSDGQISVEFGEKNNLFRRKDENGNNVGGFVDPDKRNIAAIRLRGNRSDGLVLPISCLNYCFSHGDASIEFHAGDAIDGLVNGHEVCCKYVPIRRAYDGKGKSGSAKKIKADIAPLFAEHVETEQLPYNLNKFRSGDILDISLKCHGTSQRTAYLPTEVGYERTFWDKIFKRSGKRIIEYRYICGTRRTILGESSSSWGSENFRKTAHESFIGKLHKGETVYYEVVGYNGNMTIMPSADNKKMNDKQFVATYGNRTEFSYGCNVGTNDFYVYRMTLTLEDGYILEYSPEQIRRRCEEMGVKTVLHFEEIQIPTDCENPGTWAQTEAEKFYDGIDPIGKTHIREGVVVRIVNRTSFEAYKIKNYAFKVLSGIAIADAESNAATDNLSDDVIAEM